MVKISSLRVDPELVVRGRWVAWAAGIRLRIARWNNAGFTAELSRLISEKCAELGRADLTDEETRPLIREAGAKFICTGWENVDDDEGAPLPYRWETALGFFLDPAYADLWEFIVGAANVQAEYRQRAKEVVLGNSQPASRGSSRGAGRARSTSASGARAARARTRSTTSPS